MLPSDKSKIIDAWVNLQILTAYYEKPEHFTEKFSAKEKTLETYRLLNSVVSNMPDGQLKEDTQPDMELTQCENCGEKGWDNYICHACGHKNI